MKKLLKNLIAVFLFVGVLASCESTDPLITEAQKNLVLQNFDEALALLDQSIEKNPQSGVPYYYKAMVFADKAAMTEGPENREPLYYDFRENVDTARQKFSRMEEKPEEASQLDNLVISSWGYEHNLAIQYATNDSVMQSVEDPLGLAASHLENAIIINPDSALSYEVLAQVYFIDGKTDQAIAAQRKAMARRNPPTSEDFGRMSDYYLKAEKTDSSLFILNKGISLYPDSIALSQKLADAYMANGMRDSSIAVIEKLLEIEPDNQQYHLALGTRLLQATTNMSDSISANYEKIFQINNSIRGTNTAERESLEARIAQLEQQNLELQKEIDELSAYAEQELKTVIEQDEDNVSAYNALGIIYQNKAAALFDLRNYTEDNAQSSEYDKQAKDALREAMKYYEKVVELDPDHTNAWNSLSGIYYTLDMREKAEEALEKAGN